MVTYRKYGWANNTRNLYTIHLYTIHTYIYLYAYTHRRRWWYFNFSSNWFRYWFEKQEMAFNFRTDAFSNKYIYNLYMYINSCTNEWNTSHMHLRMDKLKSVYIYRYAQCNGDVDWGTGTHLKREPPSHNIHAHGAVLPAYANITRSSSNLRKTPHHLVTQKPIPRT